MRLLPLLLPLVVACAPAHLQSVGAGGSRDFSELFLGGWDGRRLGAFDDTHVEPGHTDRAQLVRVLGHLSGDVFGLVWVEHAKLDDATAAKFGLFCEQPLCIAVLDRKGKGGDVTTWGKAVAVFELIGDKSQTVGNVWLSEGAVRPPGPRSWAHLCRDKDDVPRWIHPDGGALFPARTAASTKFALFGPTKVPRAYLDARVAAPSDTLCDDVMVKELAEPPPELPDLRPDPSIIGLDP